MAEKKYCRSVIPSFTQTNPLGAITCDTHRDRHYKNNMTSLDCFLKTHLETKCTCLTKTKKAPGITDI